MNHAILIMAHKDVKQIIHLIEYFRKDCYVFVHIDKKSNISKKEIADIESLPCVTKVFTKYNVRWGGISMLNCELFMLRESRRLCDAEYFHIISGQDYPINPINYFLNFFQENRGNNFIELVHLPHPGWDHYTYSRFQYYYPFNYVSRSPSTINKIIRFLHIQKKIGIRRRIPDVYNHLYGSSQWFSITRESVDILLKRTWRHYRLKKRLKFVFAPEECYIATIIANEACRTKIIPKNLRYIRWKYENGNSPANLDERHFYYLLGNQNLFARKMDYCSDTLMHLIDYYLIREETNKIHMKDGIWYYNGFQQYKINYMLANSIASISRENHLTSLIDIGCGADFYVIALRKLGVPVIGYDANPYTKYLSQLLSPEVNAPCDTADFTDDIDIETPYDMSICLNTLGFIPTDKLNKFVHNVIKATKKMYCV